MPRPAARFQARSALSGVGFTTTESEAVVAHPARRRIIMALMLVGSVGLATSIAGILGGLLGGTPTAGDRVTRGLVLVAGLALVYAASTSSRVDRRLSKLIGRGLARYTDLDVRDYAALLHVAGEYEVKEMVGDTGGLDHRSHVGRAAPPGRGGAGPRHRPGRLLPRVPDKNTRIVAGDTLILYGRDGKFVELTERQAGAEGDRAHEMAVAEPQDARTG